MRKNSKYEACFATSVKPNDFADIEQTWSWTGWKRRHWPAYVVRPGLLIYAFNLRSRCLEALLEVTRGGTFQYRSAADFKRGVKRITGRTPDLSDSHWQRIPKNKLCTGLALRWNLVKTVNIPLTGKFPHLGWHELCDRSVTQSYISDSADLYREADSILRKHLAVERNPKLRADSKVYWRNKFGGKLHCIICKFEFQLKYGIEWIEMHHVEPISTSKKKLKSVKDLVPVCSNCHRMIHINPREPKSLDVMRKMLSKQK